MTMLIDITDFPGSKNHRKATYFTGLFTTKSGEGLVKVIFRVILAGCNYYRIEPKMSQSIIA